MLNAYDRHALVRVLANACASACTCWCTTNAPTVVLIWPYRGPRQYVLRRASNFKQHACAHVHICEMFFPTGTDHSHAVCHVPHSAAVNIVCELRAVCCMLSDVPAPVSHVVRARVCVCVCVGGALGWCWWWC